jgi:hypothetical protein
MPIELYWLSPVCPSNSKTRPAMPIAPGLSSLWPYILPVLLLSCSNIFMTSARYSNLKFKAWTMVFAILVSWGIAGARQPDQQRDLLARRVEEHTGSHHAYRFCGVISASRLR